MKEKSVWKAKGSSKVFPWTLNNIFGPNFLAFDLSLIRDARCTSITVVREEGTVDRMPPGSEHLQITKIQFQQNQNHWLPQRRMLMVTVSSLSFIEVYAHKQASTPFCRDFPPIWSPFKLPLSISWIYLYWCLRWIVLLRHVKTPFPPPWLGWHRPAVPQLPTALHRCSAIMQHDSEVIKANSAWHCSSPAFYVFR